MVFATAAEAASRASSLDAMPGLIPLVLIMPQPSSFYGEQATLVELPMRVVKICKD